MDFMIPKPASESADAFRSPVPTQSCPLALPSSKYLSEPIALLMTFNEVRKVQVGLAASALVVLQTPPPAAAIHTRQKPALHPLCVSNAKAVIRPEVVICEPVNERMFGIVAVVGPISDQVLKRDASGGCFLFFPVTLPLTSEPPLAPDKLLAEADWNRLQPTTAFSCNENGVSSAGKARLAASSMAGVIGVAGEPSFMFISEPASATLVLTEDLLMVVVTSWVVSTFVVVATNARAAAAAKNAQPTLARRYVTILVLVFMDWVRAGVWV